ncbi:fructose bisphosphate aldolase [Jannaschia sp. M317]|uniref:fructose bisphosphate aldolase n=1 Tax=Jannaschia sp. M317 TaxID=2867011 RepID=UPI0021A9742F|nr:fructose bisphosphate aldolase [Jannaschia sp. M317]UWQ16975.1 fructose bisphosphate aldolase [Jannaschia sp. M317]
MTQTDKAAKIRAGQGFIAALDQSGGSSPKALRLYGVEENRYSNDDEMFDLIHGMRARIVRAPAFTGDKVIGAILFEQTMDRDFEGTPSAAYLWDKKGVVPFLKIDKGLEDASQGVQLMRPMPDLDATLERARGLGVFGTKERSVVGAADAAGIEAIVAQQFQVGNQVLSHGMVPILEPEVTISIADKAQAEALLRDTILKHLDSLPDGQEIMLKLTLPEEDNFYQPLADHPKVMRVVALSGGYSRDEANARLARNRGIIASFSRALTEGLSDQQDDDTFNAEIGRTIESIRAASVAG